MSEITPPTGSDEPLPPPIPPTLEGPGKPPSKKLLAALGGVLFIVTILLCIVSPLAFLLGFAAAIISLFFAGYRFLAVGYFLTLGVVLLGSIIYCSTTNFRID